MKFFIDRCAGSRLAEWLRQQGHDVVESRERGTDPGDRVLLGWAASEGRILSVYPMFLQKNVSH